MNHSDVIRKFADRVINKRTGDVDWKGSRVFCDGTNLYSFGHHFTLARYLGEEKGRHVFLKNGDRDSITTSQHQAAVQSACYGPTVSYSGLMAAGIPTRTLDLSLIVDWTPAMVEYLHKCKANNKFYKDWDYEKNEPVWSTEWKAPKAGMFIPGVGDHDTPDAVFGCWHVLGAVLLAYRDSHYLCSIDEGRYFVSKLKDKPRTVKAAFASLKPTAVRKAEKAGRLVTRQGEWFFVATDQEYVGFAATLGMSKSKLLATASWPRRSSPSSGVRRPRRSWPGTASARSTPGSTPPAGPPCPAAICEAMSTSFVTSPTAANSMRSVGFCTGMRMREWPPGNTGRSSWATRSTRSIGIPRSSPGRWAGSSIETHPLPLGKAVRTTLSGRSRRQPTSRVGIKYRRLKQCFGSSGVEVVGRKPLLSGRFCRAETVDRNLPSQVL